MTKNEMVKPALNNNRLWRQNAKKLKEQSRLQKIKESNNLLFHKDYNGEKWHVGKKIDGWDDCDIVNFVTESVAEVCNFAGV